MTDVKTCYIPNGSFVDGGKRNTRRKPPRPRIEYISPLSRFKLIIPGTDCTDHHVIIDTLEKKI